MEKIKKHLELLGLPVVDAVTGFAGVVTSVSFDLYGCIQCVVVPPVGKDKEKEDSRWLDIGRLKANGTIPVMEVPNFDYGVVAEGRKGPAAKPAVNNRC